MTTPKQISPLRRFLGWGGVLFYLAWLSPVGVGLMGLLGALDPDHHPILAFDDTGVRLVLHHEGDCRHHQHHAMARALTAFAKPVNAGDPDHVVQFASATGTISNRNSSLPSFIPTEVHSVVLPLFRDQTYAQRGKPIVPSDSPPGIKYNLQQLRVTVLLI